ncbi:Rho termination protein [[Limnothrix rosea] IAM M-220]|nr:Rho termination protein [[Limnothrix rosea] IAM M-220]
MANSNGFEENFEEMTLRQLRKVASRLNISRYSRMRKDQLLAEVKQKANYNTNPIAAKAPTEETANPVNREEEETLVEAAKFEIGQDNPVEEDLATADEDLGDLPGGYGQSRIVLLPRDPQWAYAYWDIPNDHKQYLRNQGGQQIALRLYDVTDLDLNHQAPHNVQEYLCDEMAREWYFPIPVSDRDYILDIGYRCADGRWLSLAKSAPIRVPPVYPSDWVEDIFVTVNWEEDLQGKTVYNLVPPAKKQAEAAAAAAAAAAAESNPIYDEIFGDLQSLEAQRIAGSLYGSMQHVAGSVPPQESLSSYVFPSGMGMWAVPNASGLSNVSGLNMSGAGFASMPPARPRKFWLVADAELIVYGATEPDATVTIGGQPIKLNPDGTFRFQMSFQDGNIDYPIVAVAADGEQTRSVHMTFDRATPSRNTNTKEDAVEEWFA